MENILQAQGDNIDIVYCHGVDMAIGAITAIKAANYVPGEDMQVVCVDASIQGRHGSHSCRRTPLCMHGVEREPKTGESVYCSSYQYATGGKGSNQAYAAAMLGADASLVGRIGTDENGKRILEQLHKAEVKTEYVVTDPEHLTGLSTMNIYPDGTYFSIGATGANQYISPEDVRKALDAEHFEMVLMQLEMPLETVYATYEMAKERSIPVCLDAGPAMRIPLDRLNGIFILSTNEAEAETMTGICPDTKEHILEAAETLYKEARPQYVILKLGKRGAFLYDGKKVTDRRLSRPRN